MTMDLSVNQDVAALFEAHLDEQDALGGENISPENPDSDSGGERDPAPRRKANLREVTPETDPEPEADPDPEPTETPEEDAGEDAGVEASGEEGEGEEGEDVIETWDDIAETFDVDPAELLGHIQIQGRGENSVSLEHIVNEWRNAPESIANNETELAEMKAGFQKEHDERLQGLQAQTLMLMQRNESENHSQDWWDKLAEENPGEWIKRDRQRREDQRAIEEAFSTMKAEGERRTQASSETHSAYVAEQGELLFKLRPDWSEDKAGKAAHADIGSCLKRSGFSQEQRAELVDARSILTVWKAAQFDKMQDKAPALRKRLRKLPRKHRGTSARDDRPQKSAATRRFQASSERLRKTGRLEDGIEAFERFVDS